MSCPNQSGRQAAQVTHVKHPERHQDDCFLREGSSEKAVRRDEDGKETSVEADVVPLGAVQRSWYRVVHSATWARFMQLGDSGTQQLH